MKHFEIRKKVEIKDVYGNDIDINFFDGCHPMVQAESTKKSNSSETPVRQKEAHLVMHWLSECIKQKNTDVVHYLVSSDDVCTDGHPKFPSNDHSYFLDGKNLSYDRIRNLYMNHNEPKKSGSLKILHEIILPILKQRLLNFDDLLSHAPLAAQEKVTIGDRSIHGWTLQDVEDKGNCFYLSIVDQMRITSHSFISTIPIGTFPQDSLRLHVQGESFKDNEWADIQEILQAVRQLNIAIAIVDTRSPALGFRCYYPISNTDSGEVAETYDPALMPVDVPVMRLAYTGNHYLSVHTHPSLSKGAIRSDLVSLIYSYGNLWGGGQAVPNDTGIVDTISDGPS